MLYKTGKMNINDPQPSTIRNYYRVQASVYDATRWSFLFGRNKLLAQLPIESFQETTLLEVGCGTGRNLRILAKRHPNLRLTGVDVSPDMLTRAEKATKGYAGQVQLFEAPYPSESFQLTDPVDIVLFSYSLTMFNPGWEDAIKRAWNDLRPGGHIAVVDFHNTPLAPFRWWLDNNHVRMDGHLLPYLQQHFRTEFLSIQPAWFGIWSHFMFVGIKI